MHNSTFFHLADDQLTDLIDLNAFKASLVLAILFHEKVVIDRAYLLNSRHIRAYLLEPRVSFGGTSILKHFTKTGVISIALRDNENTNMHDLFDDLVQSFSDVDGTFNEEKNASIIEYLDDLKDGIDKKGLPKSKKSIIRNGVDYGYCDMVQSFLQLDDKEIIQYANSKIDENWLKSLWAISREWRIDCFEEAKNKTDKTLGVALRRSDFYKSIGSLAYKENNLLDKSKINDTEYLIKSLPKKQGYALNFISTCVDQMHHMELSKKFNSKLQFPVINQLSPILLKKFVKDLEGDELEEVINLDFEVSLPSLESLISMDPLILHDLREKFIGKYLTYLDYYQKAQGESKIDRYKDLAEHIRNYCDAISRKSTVKIYTAPSWIKPTLLKDIENSVKNLASQIGAHMLFPESFYLSLFAGAGFSHLMRFTKDNISSNEMFRRSYKLEVNLSL